MERVRQIKVSVVMPVYNGEDYLNEAIESILTQTYENFEFIIINDGSTDSSEEIIQSYNDSRIIYLCNEKNYGICYTLNRGLKEAKGKYIVRMDCDDISLPNRIIEQVLFMEQHPDIGVAGSNLITFEKGKPDNLFIFPHTVEECKAGMLFNTPLAHPATIIRNSILQKYALHYEEEYKGLEDFKLWWEISKFTKITNINKTLIKYRIHTKQETKKQDARVSQKDFQFAQIRLETLGFKITEQQEKLFNAYRLNQFYKFNKQSIQDFIFFCKKIIQNQKEQSLKEKRAIKITLTRAIALLCDKCLNTSTEKIYFIWTAFYQGICPIIWLIKLTYHILL